MFLHTQNWHVLCVSLGMLVPELMTRDPKSLSATGGIHDAVSRAAELEIRQLPVMGGSGRAGIVGAPSLSKLLAPDGQGLRLDTRWDAVPIIQQDPPALVGIVSYVDILKEAKEAL